MEHVAKISDNYLNILSSVSDEIKLRIINKLSETLLTKKEKPSIKDSFGAWKDNQTAEEIISNIRNSRVLGTRKIESFDE